MPPDPSVTSACEGARLCPSRLSSALLPKSLERPGPKSVSPATYCSGVEVVVWCRWIVDMRASFSRRWTPANLSPVAITPADTDHTGFFDTARVRRRVHESRGDEVGSQGARLQAPG